MKLSINWLDTYFNNKPNWDDVFEKLTMAGIEVEGIEDTPTDKIVEFKITPNRGDALSIRGLLREISVLTGDTPIMPAQNLDFKSKINDKIEVDVVEPNACPHYMALVIKNVNNKVKLPNEIIERLTASGSRSISPIVDITNYVMLELGQPLHAFDLNKVGNKLSVRFAKDGEQIHLLADVEAKLTDKTLLICDYNNQPAAIAGVMGGSDTGVSDNSTDIVLESAFFVPNIIIGKTRLYSINSDSAYRYERGVDPQLQDLAIKYAANLIVKYCGGDIGQINVSSTSHDFENKQISVDYVSINRLIGANIKRDTIKNILIKLGFIIINDNDVNIDVQVPSHRFDIVIKEDIVEEIARIYGYDKIEAQIPITRYTMRANNSNIEHTLKTKLVNLGYSEIISYAFLEEKLESQLGNPSQTAVQLKNPIANLNVMRTSLVADLVKALQHNLNYGHKRLRIFELARVFHGETQDLQPLKLSGLIYGNFTNPSPLSPSRSVDFYDIRNDVEILLSGLGETNFVVCDDNSVFHGGRCATIVLCGRYAGILGQLHPKYKAELGLTELPYLFELDLDGIKSQRPKFVVKEVSKFQKVERDLAFLIESQVNVGNVIDKIMNANIPYLINANVFDIYQGDKLADEKLNGNSVKSVAINFLFQSTKTLNEEEINMSMALVQQCIQANFTIRLRI